MSRHLICDAHEWVNEIPTVPTIVVPRCLKCQDLGHVSKYCSKTETTCRHCGDIGHEMKDCPKRTEPSICIPCKYRAKPCKGGSDCQTHKMLLDRMIQNTDYGQ
ncbi:hypothetical protein JTB14_016134 [Gonioctena quinquepunctata]|nr:hypothetical protein JTB14_016134 [Gonioctena quinquepunctata]